MHRNFQFCFGNLLYFLNYSTGYIFKITGTRKHHRAIQSSKLSSKNLQEYISKTHSPKKLFDNLVPSANPETRECDQLTTLPKIPEHDCNKPASDIILNIDKKLEEFTRWKIPGPASDFVPNLSEKEVSVHMLLLIY